MILCAADGGHSSVGRPVLGTPRPTLDPCPHAHSSHVCTQPRTAGSPAPRFRHNLIVAPGTCETRGQSCTRNLPFCLTLHAGTTAAGPACSVHHR